MTTPTLLADPEPTPFVFPAGSYAARVVADGASNYWRLGESAGTTAVDIISGANGTISGGVTLGQPGGVPGDTAMLFNGTTGQIVTVAPLPWFAAFTIEAWIKVTSPPDYVPIFSNRNATPAHSQILFSVIGNRLLMYSDNATPTVSFESVKVVADGAWHHVVATSVGSALKLYVDGQLDNSTSTTFVAPTADIAGIGYENNTPFRRWPGSLDEVAIYPRALAPSEVAAHYAAGKTLGPGDTTTLWRKWQDANQAFNNEEHAALLNGFPPQDLTTQLSRFLWGSYASTQNPTAAHDRYVNMVLADGASHFWRGGS